MSEVSYLGDMGETLISLNLVNNRLTSVAKESLELCTKLQELDISQNQFDAMPDLCYLSGSMENLAAMENFISDISSMFREVP